MNFPMIQRDTPWDAHYRVHYYTKFGITSLSVIYVARRCICCLRNRARRESLQSKLFALPKIRMSKALSENLCWQFAQIIMFQVFGGEC